MKRWRVGVALSWAVVLILGAVLTAVFPSATQAQDQIVHVVQQGENLFRLALRYGTTVQAIMVAEKVRKSRVIDSLPAEFGL